MGQPWSQNNNKAKPTSIEPWTPTPKDIATTKLLLAQSGQLPNEIVTEIMNHAEYWAVDELEYDRTWTISNAKQVLFEVEDLFETLKYFKPKGLGPGKGGPEALTDRQDEDVECLGKLERIRWTVTSHDQGWSSYPQDQGTYHNSWTWFEVKLILPEPPPTLPAKTALPLATPPSHPPPNPDSQIEPPPDNQDWHQICINVHAMSDFKTHSPTWTPQHPFFRQLILARSLQPANHTNRLGLKVRAVAQFPGWTNTVKHIRCQFFYSF